MDRSACTVGMEVWFGRGKGEKTRGVVEKMGPSKAKVKTLEARGVQKTSPAGAIWTVPYSLMTPVGAGPATVPVHDSNGSRIGYTSEKIAFRPFDHVENMIMAAIVMVHCRLSPENLTCDGELPRHQVLANQQCLLRQLRGLEMAMGRKVTEQAAIDWDDARQAWEKQHQTV